MTWKGRWLASLMLLTCIFVAACEDDPENEVTLQEILDSVEVDKYADIVPIRTEQVGNWEYSYFSSDDCRCVDGSDNFFVAVQEGDPERVLYYLEGGGAEWPGGGLALTIPLSANRSGFKSSAPENPLADWTIVYVSYCDGSIFAGDNTLFYDNEDHYFWGTRNNSAGINLMHSLYPDAKEIVLSGSSAGAYGTFIGYGIMRDRFPDTPILILNDSGTGFWNPNDVATWELIKESWDIGKFFPDECATCQGTSFLGLYELFMDYDPNLRIGMVSSYEDSIISSFFLAMSPEDFRQTLVAETDKLRAAHPDRFKRFFFEGSSHTTIEFLLPEGIFKEINGVPMHTWIDGLVNRPDQWQDLLE